MEPARAAQILRVSAMEAVEEPDTIARRPEVIDVLEALARDAQFCAALARFSDGRVSDPASYLRALSQALIPYRDTPLDDAPELVEALASVAQALAKALDEQPTSDTPAVAVA